MNPRVLYCARGGFLSLRDWNGLYYIASIVYRRGDGYEICMV